VDRVIAVDVQEDSNASAAGFESGMALLNVNGYEIKTLEDLYRNLTGSKAQDFTVL